MRQLCLLTMGLIGAGLLATEQACQAALTTFKGVDANATSTATGPNSTAAEAAFMIAAGTVQTADFENTGLPDGDIVGQTLTPGQLGVTGMTIMANDPVVAEEDLGLNSISFAGSTVGFNTTPSGENRLVFLEAGSGEPAAELQFNFDDPIFAFGLYISGGGANNSTSGFPKILAGGDTIPVDEFLSNPQATGGLQYIGFTSDTGLTQVLLRIDPESGSNDFFFGIDDVSFSTAHAPNVPEPSSMALLSLGALSLLCWGRRRMK